MFVPQILVSAPVRRLALTAAVVALLAACGQKGPLFLPKGDASVGRSSLPETLSPSTSTNEPASGAATPPATGKASPVRNP
jgi:predicted small lipoprotein YifL